MLQITRIDREGNIFEHCFFSNKETAKYNMITLFMQLNKCGNIWDNDLRERFENRITESGNHLFFEHNEQTYICKRK